MIQEASGSTRVGALATREALLRLIQDQIMEQQLSYILIIYGRVIAIAPQRESMIKFEITIVILKNQSSFCLTMATPFIMGKWIHQGYR